MEALYKARKMTASMISALNYLAILACVVSILAVGIDVVLRKLTGAHLSVPGSSEITAYSLVLMCMLSIPALQLKNGHISLELLRDRLPGKKKWETAALAGESIICWMLSYASILKVQMFFRTGTSTDVLNLPKWPFAAACLIGFAEMALLLTLDCCIQAFEMRKENRSNEEKQ